jgi:hypothetical protein
LQPVFLALALATADVLPAPVLALDARDDGKTFYLTQGDIAVVSLRVEVVPGRPEARSSWRRVGDWPVQARAPHYEVLTADRFPHPVVQTSFFRGTPGHAELRLERFDPLGPIGQPRRTFTVTLLVD